MRVALDTNRYRDLVDGHAATLEILERAQTVFVPFVVLAELRAGFAVGSQSASNEAVLSRFLAKPGVELLFADEGTTTQYAHLFRQLRTQGTPIPTKTVASPHSAPVQSLSQVALAPASSHSSLP